MKLCKDCFWAHNQAGRLEIELSSDCVCLREALVSHVEEIEAAIGERKAANRKVTAARRKAKQAGFRTEILDDMIKERALDPEVHREQYSLKNAYREALDMLGDYADTPLGEAAVGPLRAAAEDDDADPMVQQRAANIAAVEATRDARRAGKPIPFAQQPVRRDRPKKVLFDREHPEGLPPAA